MRITRTQITALGFDLRLSAFICGSLLALYASGKRLSGKVHSATINGVSGVPYALFSEARASAAVLFSLIFSLILAFPQ
jgi:hypothetical protein